MFIKSFIAAATLLFAFSSTHGQQTNKSALLNGAWQSADNKGFTIIHDRYFNSVSQDSTGKWADVHAGTYTVNDNNTVTFKVLYSSYPDHIGSLNTAEYSIIGETLKIHHFKKLVNGEGKDITEQVPKDVKDTLTRLK